MTGQGQGLLQGAVMISLDQENQSDSSIQCVPCLWISRRVPILSKESIKNLKIPYSILNLQSWAELFKR